MEGYKTCNKCGESKPRSEFHKDRTAKHGLSKKCKACIKIHNRTYYKANKDKIAAQRQAFKEANLEANSERKFRYNQAYYKNNRKKILAQKNEYQQANPRKMAASKARHRARKADGGVFVMLDKELQRLYASPCVACGATDNIQLDHIIPVSRGGQTSIGNSQPLCGPCNASKKDKLPIEWRVWLDQSAGLSVGAA